MIGCPEIVSKLLRGLADLYGNHSRIAGVLSGLILIVEDFWRVCVLRSLTFPHVEIKFSSYLHREDNSMACLY